MVLAAVSNTLRYDPDLCINCDMCSIVCPHGVFAPGESVAELVDPEACMECGACQRNCPADAIQVESGVGCASAMIRAALRGQKLGDAACGSNTLPCCGGGEAAVEVKVPAGRDDIL